METMEQRFYRFVKEAKQGDRLVYFVGENLLSSIASTHIGSIAREEYKKGLVVLHNKRLPDRRMSYLAVRTKKVYKDEHRTY